MRARAAWATSNDRVLLVIGAAIVLAAVWIAAVYVRAGALSAAIQADVATARSLHTLGDQLMTDVQRQHEELGKYLMSADSDTLAQYWQAVAGEHRVTGQIEASAGSLAGIAAALADVSAESSQWRTSVARPAIIAADGDSIVRRDGAIRSTIEAPATNRSAVNDFVRQIDVVEADLGARAEALQRFRIQATGLGVVTELVAACLSLWYVRRYGLRIARDARRRSSASAERSAIVTSLRTLRTQQTPEATAAAIAGAMLGLPGVDGAAVFEFIEDRALVLAVVGLPRLTADTGEALPDGHARYLQECAAGGPWAIPFVRPTIPNPHVEQAAIAGVESMAFAPIQADGQLIGVIGIATTDEDLGRHFVEDLPAVAEFASVAEAILAPALLARRQRGAAQRRIAATIASRAFGPVFQPIVELSTGTTVGYEALTRFDDGGRPDRVLAEAALCGMGIELETVTLEAALREARHLAPGTWLSLNVSPAMLAEGRNLRRVLADRTDGRVLEITEHEKIEAYGPLREAMLRLGPGIRLAVDDAGAGVANFNHLVELRPNFVKIDIGLVRGVNADPSRRAVVVALVHFAAEAGCQVIAEGIETEAERATVAELGVTLGQGFLLARPAPAATWSIALPGSPVAARPAAGRAPLRRRRSGNRLDLLRAPGPGQLGDFADRTWGMPPLRGGDQTREDPGVDTRTGATIPVATRPWLPH